jgi:glycerol-3-phosphate acyltransferase PlsY
VFESIIALLVAFALGSIPTAFIAGKLLSRGDIRDAGSGNPGTLNAVRQYGKLVGLIVLLVDAGKGILAVIVAQALSVADLWVYATALSVTLGHNFSPVLRFRGGKGAATVLGISAFMLWQITAISGAAGLLVLLLTRHGVLAVICVFIVLNALTIVTGQATGQIVLCIVLSVLVAGTHLWRQSDEVSDAVRGRSWRRFLSIE